MRAKLLIEDDDGSSVIAMTLTVEELVIEPEYRDVTTHGNKARQLEPTGHVRVTVGGTRP